MSEDKHLSERLAALEARIAHLEAGQQGAIHGAEIQTRAYCALPPVPQRALAPEVAPLRRKLIRLLAKKWVNGTVLRYYFFDRDTDGEHLRLPDGTSAWRSYVGDDAQRDVVRRAFAVWAEIGIGISFEEVTAREDAEIRVGFMPGDGAWSYLGRDIIDLAPSANERTMSFGWDLTEPGELDTVVHEIGHTLGFPHEHQNPNAGIVWDEEAVYAAMARPPNGWSRDVTHFNVIRKLDPGEIHGSSWDPDSIMHYPFPAGLIRAPAEYASGVQPAPGLSARDRAMVKRFYPPLEDTYPALVPFRSELLILEPGGQKDFEILPPATRYYEIRTFGASDTLMVLFEDEDGTLRYRTADDDSGVARNACLRVKLIKGRRYVLRIRLYYSDVSGQTAVMLT